MKNRRRAAALMFAAVLLTSPVARGQGTPGWGVVNLWGMWNQTSSAGSAASQTSDFTEVNASVAIQSPSVETGGFEYGVNTRGATFPSTSGRSNEYSLYEAWVGARTPGGLFGLRVGQMWLSELGSLGAVGGALLSFRQPEPWGVGRLRAGIFGGLDPDILNVGYAKGVRKYGGFLALDGANGRSHVIGWVRMTDSGMTERSVLTMTNFVPIGHEFFLYQAAEYDLAKPGGLAKSGLHFLFGNLRWTPVSRVEFQGLYHRGISIDSRTITQDQLAGRPVDSRTLQGFLFESYGGRITVEVVPSVHIYAGYTRSRDNQGDAPYDQTTLGLFASNVFRSGVDVTVSDNRSNRTSGSFDAWYASLGRNLGGKFYVSANYSTSLSVLTLTNTGGVTVTSRPRSKDYSLYGLWNIDRHFSLSLTGDHLIDESSKSNRVMLGLMYRF